MVNNEWILLELQFNRRGEFLRNKIRPRKKLVQVFDHAFDSFRHEPIIGPLSGTINIHNALITQHPKMLRNTSLWNSEGRYYLTDVESPVFCEHRKNEEPRRFSKRFESTLQTS